MIECTQNGRKEYKTWDNDKWISRWRSCVIMKLQVGFLSVMESSSGRE